MKLCHYESGQVLSALASVHPKPLLEDYLHAGQERGMKGLYFHEWLLTESRLSESGRVDALEWCSFEPEVRFPGLASVFDPFERSGVDSVTGWTVFGLELVKQAPTSVAVLNQFKSHLYPSCWSGSYGLTLRAMLPIVDKLKELELPEVNQWVEECRAELQQRIGEELARDAEESRRESERFE